MNDELSALVWRNFDRVLAAKRITASDFKRLVRRNKNTYTNWFKDPRPVLKITDLNDIATALDIPAIDLLTPMASAQRATNQLELPFDGNSNRVTLQIESHVGGLVLRARASPPSNDTDPDVGPN